LPLGEFGEQFHRNGSQETSGLVPDGGMGAVVVPTTLGVAASRYLRQRGQSTLLSDSMVQFAAITPQAARG
jgi:hypothetical protein